jgi:hypothetical protein
VTSLAIRDLAERLVATFALAFIANVVVTQHGANVQWFDALGVAGFATLIVAGTTVLVRVAKLHLVDPLGDLLIRSALTFVQYVLGAMIAASAASLFTFHWSTVLLGALVATAGSAMKALAGIANPGTKGASVAVPKAA